MLLTGPKGLNYFLRVSRVVLSQVIENIRDLGGADQVVSLELTVENLEKDVGE